MILLILLDFLFLIFGFVLPVEEEEEEKVCWEKKKKKKKKLGDGLCPVGLPLPSSSSVVCSPPLAHLFRVVSPPFFLPLVLFHLIRSRRRWWVGRRWEEKDKPKR
jgi:hypothetical protein